MNINTNDNNNSLKLIDDLDIIDSLYERNDDEDLTNLINLIKLDDDSDFKTVFRNHLLYLIKPNEDNNFLDFKQQKNTTILNYILNYIINQKDLKKLKENYQNSNNIQEDVKQENQSTNINKDKNNENSIEQSNNQTNSSNLDTSLFFSINENLTKV